MIPQYQTEAILLDKLRVLGRGIFRPYQVVELRQDADGVDVAVAADGAAAQRVRARYVVGADGMHSLVRERAGIGFVGDTYEQSFVLADVRLSWALDREEVMLFFSPRDSWWSCLCQADFTGSSRRDTRCDFGRTTQASATQFHDPGPRSHSRIPAIAGDGSGGTAQ